MLENKSDKLCPVIQSGNLWNVFKKELGSKEMESYNMFME